MNDDMDRAWEKEKSQMDVWKYYGTIGGADKDKMIKIVTWLLTVSTGIVGFYATGQIKAIAALLFSLGAVISFLAGFIALLYGGYAAWNWAIADRIAEKYKWDEQCPSFRPIPKPKRWMDRLPLWLAEPCENNVAPVFWVFFIASLVSLFVHCWLLLTCCHLASASPQVQTRLSTQTEERGDLSRMRGGSGAQLSSTLDFRDEALPKTRRG